MKKIAILGSTGSIGTQTLDVIRAHSDELEVVALAAGSNKERLKEQIREFHPELVSLSDEKKAQELKEELAGEAVEVVCGMDGLIEVAGIDSADVVVTAVVGMLVTFFSWWMNLGFPPADASVWVVLIDALFVVLASTGIVSIVTSEWLAKLFGSKIKTE